MSERKMPSNFEVLFPGRFLKAGLFEDRAVTLEITDIFLEALPSDKGDQTRGVLAFKQTPMQLSINKTNGLCLRAMFGKKPAEWIGKRVTFVSELDKFGQETVDAIRIKGSPDITEPIDVQIRMPKKKPKTRRLVPTVKNDTASVSQPDNTANNETTTVDNETGEVK